MAVAVLGTTGHLLLIMALGKAPASTLMPFQYVQLGVAALAGYIAFGVAPDALGWVGMAIIGVCGAMSAWLNGPRPSPTSPPPRGGSKPKRTSSSKPTSPTPSTYQR